jgi:hypothetical protein
MRWLRSGAVSMESRVRCLPSSSKLDGFSHAKKASLIAGHSRSTALYHAVSRLRTLTMVACRKMPSNESPRRCAAAREDLLRASHFHSCLICYTQAVSGNSMDLGKYLYPELQTLLNLPKTSWQTCNAYKYNYLPAYLTHGRQKKMWQRVYASGLSSARICNARKSGIFV